MAQRVVADTAAAAIVIITLAVSFSPSAAQSQCQTSYALRSCFPDYVRYMQRGVNLTGIFKFFSSERNMQSMCGRLNTVLDCIDDTMRGCAAESDPYDTVTQYWKRASDIMTYVCRDRRHEFLESQRCLSSYDVSMDGRRCDTSTSDGYDSWGSRSRRTCQEYEQEVMCADEVVLRHCGHMTARMMARVTRQLLKNTQDTNDCYEPMFSAAGKSVSSLKTLCLSAGVSLIAYKLL